LEIVNASETLTLVMWEVDDEDLRVLQLHIVPVVDPVKWNSLPSQ